MLEVEHEHVGRRRSLVATAGANDSQLRKRDILNELGHVPQKQLRRVEEIEEDSKAKTAPYAAYRHQLAADGIGLDPGDL